jgi:hypothetical protein
MDERFQAILDSLPPKQPRSRLEPYWELIREMRRRGRTYREIAHVLADKCQVTVAASTIHDFVQLRSKNRSRKPQAELPSRPEAETTEPAPAAETAASGAASDDEVRARIDAIKRRPQPEKPKRVFEYDENEPLRVIRENKQEG